MRSKEDRVKELFKEMHLLNVCGDDPDKVARKIEKTNLNAKVFIVAEAMAPEQVRLSGVNYFYKDGRIGSTGRSLERFLLLFNSSVYPDHPNCVYHTEIVHNFPGYVMKDGKKSIRRPTRKEIEDSISYRILEKEIAVINPKVILLMGNTAYQSFYKYTINIPFDRNLSEEIDRISNGGRLYFYNKIPVVPIQHSSGANPRFSAMLKNKPLIDLIKGILNS